MVDSLIFGLAWSGPRCYVTNLVVTSFYIIGPAQPRQARLQIRTCQHGYLDDSANGLFVIDLITLGDAKWQLEWV